MSDIEIYHYSTSGVELGSFATPGRFVDGLEAYVSGAPIPEPASLLLFGTGAAMLVRRARRRVRQATDETIKRS